jgi:hypothetical protein
MDKDFHYYGTYTAARLAGFSVQEATTIAHSAQYVDDSTTCSERIMSMNENGLDFQPRPTSHEAMRELGWNAFDSPINPLKVPDSEVQRVWMSFHFLPGNYASTKLPDPNSQSRMNLPSPMLLTSDDAIKFKFLCLPRSPLAAAMIKDKPQQPQGKDGYWLHLLGIKMHAYADTGAHMYYAGLPAEHINNVNDNVTDLTENKLIKWAIIDWLAFKPGYEMHTPFLSIPILYLGHGRIGHIPDHSWMKYSYYPAWSSTMLTKDNPVEYMRTFLEMVLAFQYQKSDRDTFDYSHIDQDINNLKQKLSKILPAISDILNTKPDLHTRPSIGKVSLNNLGGFVVSMLITYRDDDGDLITSKPTEKFAIFGSKTIDPGDLGVPNGSYITLRVIVEGGNDKTANKELLYEKDNPAIATYTIAGTTMDNTLGFIDSSYDDPVNKRCNLWKKELATGGRLESLGLPSREYDPNLWIKDAKASKEIQKTDYYKFNAAAIEHTNFVREKMIADGITFADWGPISSKFTGIGRVSLHNGGGFVVSMLFSYRDDDGDLITSKPTEKFALGSTQKVDPGDLGVPNGSRITLKVIVEGGNDNISRQEFVYERGNPMTAAYTVTGTTLNNTLGLIETK